MNPEEYGRMKNLEKTYWWHVGRRFIIRAMLKKYFNGANEQEKSILDIGCGTGGNAMLLKEFGTVMGLDDSKEALRLAQGEGGFSKLVLGEINKLPFDENVFDCITLLDVLEHVNDEKLALDECKRVLKPGGGLIITVPAYQWLWSGHDEALHHKRRYSMAELKNKLKQAGFEIVFKTYAVSALFLAIAFYRYLDKIMGRKQESSYVIFNPIINNLFIFLLRIEALIFKLGLALPFGTSIVIIAKKSQ